MNIKKIGVFSVITVLLMCVTVFAIPGVNPNEMLPYQGQEQSTAETISANEVGTVENASAKKLDDILVISLAAALAFCVVVIISLIAFIVYLRSRIADLNEHLKEKKDEIKDLKANAQNEYDRLMNQNRQMAHDRRKIGGQDVNPASLSEAEKRANLNRMRNGAGNSSREDYSMPEAPDISKTETVESGLRTAQPEPPKPKTDEERFLEFFNEATNAGAAAPKGFTGIKMDLNGEGLKVSDSGMACFILGDEIKTGEDVYIFPGVIAKSPQMQYQYANAFEFVNSGSGRPARIIRPCVTECNAFGICSIKKKGYVEF